MATFNWAAVVRKNLQCLVLFIAMYSLHGGSANIFSKGTDNKYVRLFQPYSLYLTINSAILIISQM